MSIALFYGSSNGMTEDAAQKIAKAFKETGVDLPLFDVYQSELSELQTFDKLILGCPTWYVGELQDDWDKKFTDLDKLNLKNKQVAVFGMGDQISYSDSFQDALGILGRKCRENGAEIVGWWPTKGYKHDESLGVENDMFFGLALDDDNQSELTDQRITTWTKQLIREFNLELVVN